ncbi:TraB/GumN family protein [Pseudidiomarina terrestris]|uniref:TraB/GumN family protein n=1 Tax=Pseudidiomarina terrestris TaxID=2820060 RepID=A0AAW7QW65_9GAMM|nr:MULTISPECIES: TraB/GumN family protein [unclassified Pseudidiomarina]MDN7123687.1 TraB/GumN family protein [Pseudidiomarina sp. 1APP75-32.1]MDN7126523.1 TraB/GumN family protein [Pseudidiomarina sp. 1APR75-33.1]MDN7128589.1 TraB/GumN family protein [Pseudidiomarina sp. 1APR75-15]MDN7135153.1 TraB/GumN family protein [Pseudidiomarina sp. 1ASP75-5]MDN7137823.1 TraB/GumN family protein [Pseudidiomarina sp. 1ASP75-14]
MVKSITALLVAGALSVSTAQASLLYKVTGNDMAEPSYLFGTIHMICAEDFKVHEQTKAAFAQADRLIMELDMADPGVLQSMQTKLLDPQGRKLSSHVSEAQYELLDEFLTSTMGTGLTTFDGMRPFILSSMVMTSQLGCAQQMSYEGHFTQKAMEQQKAVDGLESVDFQFGIFDQIPYQEQVQWLMESLEDKAKAKGELDKMVRLYVAEDMEGLYKMIADTDAYADYTALLLDDRNRTWQQQLDADLQAPGSEFIAVGAGHLGGNAGIIQLLKDLGYAVEPVTTQTQD